jgi:type I restriction enzyme R subunit
MFADEICSVDSSTSITPSPRDRIGVSDPHGLLKKHGYPPDKQEQATRTVLEQAELLSEAWGFEPPERATSQPE